MPRLSEDLLTALNRAVEAPRLLVASDFDGTLSEIVAQPPDARPVPGAMAALGALAELPGVTVTLVSGRAVDSLRAVSGARPPIRLIGSHGAEYGDRVIGDPDTALRDRIVAVLDTIAAETAGVTVETKPAGAALHVRNADPQAGAEALARARAAAADWDARITEGKAVLEFSVLHTDKGTAVEHLRAESGATAVIFLGDDVTDETVFETLRDADVGVKIGPGPSAAGHRVAGTAEAVAVLEAVAAARVR